MTYLTLVLTCAQPMKKKTIFIDEKRTKFLENELDKINEKLRQT